MKKIYLQISAIVILSSLIFCVSLYYTCSFENGINLGASLVSSLSGLVTMVIAFLLIDRFGFDKKIANLQLESVIKLIQALSDFRCIVSGDKYHYQIPFTDNLTRQKEIMKQKNDGVKKLVFLKTDKDSIFQEVNKLLNDFWLPDSIKFNLKFIEYFGSIDVLEINQMPQNSLTATFGGNEMQEILIIQDSTFQEFIANVEKLNIEIRRWWSEHSQVKLQMNLKPK